MSAALIVPAKLGPLAGHVVRIGKSITLIDGGINNAGWDENIMSMGAALVAIVDWAFRNRPPDGVYHVHSRVEDAYLSITTCTCGGLDLFAVAANDLAVDGGAEALREGKFCVRLKSDRPDRANRALAALPKELVG
jgi:hypothetical protein